MQFDSAIMVFPKYIFCYIDMSAFIGAWGSPAKSVSPRDTLSCSVFNVSIFPVPHLLLLSNALYFLQRCIFFTSVNRQRFELAFFKHSGKAKLHAVIVYAGRYAITFIVVQLLIP
jgi:hypothetical protein